MMFGNRTRPLQVYLGSTRDSRFLRVILDNCWGECFVAGGPAKQPAISPLMVDNGAFGAYTKGKPWDGDRFMRGLEALSRLPQFIVAPDIVGGGVESLQLSLQWHQRCSPFGPLYLAVQDGMDSAAVERHLGRGVWAGVFVGGTTRWKWTTARRWSTMAYALGIGCHIGRAATPNGIRAAYEMGASSVDGNQPLWARRKMTDFVKAYNALGNQSWIQAMDDELAEFPTVLAEAGDTPEAK